MTSRIVFPAVIRVRATAAIITENEAQRPACVLSGLRGEDSGILPRSA